MRATDGLRQTTEGQQAEVGVGALADPADDDRQQLALDGCSATDPLSESLDVSQRPVRIRVADGGESLACRLGAQRHLVRTESGGEAQQRAVVDLLVKGAHAPAQFLEVIPEAVSPAQTGGDAALDATQILLPLRQVVGPAQAEELTAVLQEPQGLVAAAHGRGIGPTDVAARAERVEGLQGAGYAQALIGAAMDELEELDSELHVPQASGPQLDAPVHTAARHRLLFHPATHGTGVLNEVLPPAGLPHEGRHPLLVAGAERHVPGAGSGLEQGLELPGGGPSPVVGQVGVQGAYKRAVLALRAQRRVQRPQWRLRRGGGDDVGELGGQAGADVHEELLAERLPYGLRVLGLADHVDDVDVGDVVELVCPGLTHGDHG